MPLTVIPPLYLVGMKVACWRCKAQMPVVAFVAPQVAGSHGEVSILSNIQQIPAEVLLFVQKRVPTFQLRSSRTAGSKYYANTCPTCHVIYGDFYLHSEPGAPFFPESEEEAKALYITEIPLTNSVEIEASPGVGIGELILEHGKRI
jgi:hypothetical protein